MMDSQSGFILKVLLASTAISASIVYGGPRLAIPATNAIALIAVFLPAGILAAILTWRALRKLSARDEELEVPSSYGERESDGVMGCCLGTADNKKERSL